MGSICMNHLNNSQRVAFLSMCIKYNVDQFDEIDSRSHTGCLSKLLCN